ncbi:MAG: hypothetical protein ACKV22_35905 [Bryobacteraceae bacterium]
MISGIDPTTDRFLFDLERIRSRGERAARQITSGYRVSRPSDDPSAVPEIINTQSRLDHLEQLTHNLGRIQTETDGAEKGLQSAVKLLDQISVWASQGATSTTTAGTRQMLAGQVGATLDRLVAIANTDVGGRLVFAGDADQVEPYGVDWTLADGVTSYAGTAATRDAEDFSGGRFRVARTAEEIFQTSGDGNVFGAVAGLKTALAANDQAAIEAALSRLAASRDHLNGQLAFYGGVQSRIQAELDAASAGRLDQQATLTRLRETDLTEASLELVQSRTGLEAALAARSARPRSTLFDYLG